MSSIYGGLDYSDGLGFKVCQTAWNFTDRVDTNIGKSKAKVIVLARSKPWAGQAENAAFGCQFFGNFEDRAPFEGMRYISEIGADGV